MRVATAPSAPEQLERALESDLSWLATTLESGIAEVAPVSPLRGREQPRTAFRVALDDGRVVKLRRMKTPERAVELARLLARVAPLGLPQVVLQRGETLVMEWVEGMPFSAAPDGVADCERAARLLGRLHATSSFDGVDLPVARSTEGELRALDERLALLVDAGRLEARTAGRLADRARELAPARVQVGVIHGDFCPENLVVDARGEVRVVDNESLQLGPLGLDLARVWARWPLSPVAWRAFLAACRSTSGQECAESELAAWRIVTLALSASYRVAHALPGIAESLARLESRLSRL